jgi:ribonuclease I
MNKYNIPIELNTERTSGNFIDHYDHYKQKNIKITLKRRCLYNIRISYAIELKITYKAK